jgi:hypothetical protein
MTQNNTLLISTIQTQKQTLTERIILSSFLLLVLLFSPFTSLYAKTDENTVASNSDFKGTTYSASDITASSFKELTIVPGYERYDSANRWEDVKASDVLAALKNFQGIKASPALRDIWRDVLLSDFSGLVISNPNEQTTLMSERLRILNHLGFFDEAVRLYEQVAQKKPVPEKIVREGILALSLSGSADGACLETMMAARYLSSETWTQDAALCARYFGQDDLADQLFEQAAPTAGSGFRTVYRMLGKGAARYIQADIPALWRTLLLARGADLSSTAVRKADPMMLASLSANKHVALGTRLVAASRAADVGTIGFDRLRKLYEMKHKTDAQVPAILAAIESGETVSQSDLYAAARFTFEGNARAKIVETAIKQLDPRTNVKSHVYGWIVDKLTLQPDRIKWFAPTGYALMMATNRSDSAKIYYDTAELGGSTLIIIEALEDGKPWTEASQNKWKKAMRDRFGRTGEQRISRLMTLIKAYDGQNKLALLDTKSVQSDAANAQAMPLVLLKDSVLKGGRGLTLVTALNHLGKITQAQGKLDKLSTEELSEIMKVFAREGLFGPRKKIILEMLIESVL